MAIITKKVYLYNNINNGMIKTVK